ncbi:glutathione S-transferase family protein [Roseovarius sp. 2305UL8-3]|uniref:glutathione S-transferase family protein n=1 Tax=Roseovarius conchicola TaxID=3121636 RepID=UPI003527B5E0
MIKLFACLGSGNCFKPWLALHQLQIPFDLQLVDVLAGEQRSDWYTDINPNGVVPFMVTEDGRYIGESNAMLWYLAEGTYLMPADKTERAQVLQWMFFEQSKLEPFISPARFFAAILPQEKQNRAADIATWKEAAKPGLERLNAHFQDCKFIVSSGYSIGDIAVFGYVHVLEEAGLSLADYPAIARWIDDVRKTKGFLPLSKLGSETSKAA